MTFSFNWSTLLFYSAFISYGYFAAMTPSYEEFSNNPFIFLLNNFFVASVFFIFTYISIKYREYFEDKIKINYIDIFVILIIAVILLVATSDLSESLISDEIAYSYVSFSYPEFIARKIVNLSSLLDEFKYNNVVQLVSFLIILCFFTLFFILKRLPIYLRICLLLAIFISIRVIVSIIHGNSFPHPPLNLVPTLAYGSIFGIDPLILKLSFFTGYLLFILIIHKMISRNFDTFLSFMLSLCIASIPLFLNFGFRIEHSLWGGIAITIVLVDLITSKKINYMRMISFVSVFSMMRMPVFIALVPLILHYVFFKENNWELTNKKKIQEVLLMIIPALLFLPFLLNSIIFGTPSTSLDSVYDGNILDTIKSGIVIDSLVSSVSWLWIVLAVPSLMMLDFKRGVILLLTLSFLIIVYFSISQSHWGETKYQMEWFLPFSVTGMIVLFSYLKKIKVPRFVLTLFIFCLIIFNFYQYRSLLENQPSIDFLIENYEDIDNPNLGVYRIGFDYKSAYNYILQNDLQDSTFSVGVTYGIFNELLYKYKVRSYKIVSEIYDEVTRLNKNSNVNWTSADSNIIDSNEKINYLLVGLMYPDKDNFLKDMINKGWLVEKKFFNSKYKSTVHLLKRK